MTGVQGAMWLAAGLTFLAAMTAFFGLRGTPSPRNQEGPASPAVTREKVTA